MAEENVQNTPESEETVGQTENSSSDLQASQERISALEAQAKTNLDGWQRERAEFQNYKRRTDSLMNTIRQEAAGKALENFLPVIDDLELAIQSLPAEAQKGVFADGVKLVLRKALTQLEREGIRKIEVTPGMEFDPQLHEALLQSPSDQYDSGIVLAVLRQGYQVGERVLRPAQVQVSS